MHTEVVLAVFKAWLEEPNEQRDDKNEGKGSANPVSHSGESPKWKR